MCLALLPIVFLLHSVSDDKVFLMESRLPTHVHALLLCDVYAVAWAITVISGGTPAHALSSYLRLWCG